MHRNGGLRVIAVHEVVPGGAERMTVYWMTIARLGGGKQGTHDVLVLRLVLTRIVHLLPSLLVGCLSPLMITRAR